MEVLRIRTGRAAFLRQLTRTPTGVGPGRWQVLAPLLACLTAGVAGAAETAWIGRWANGSEARDRRLSPAGARSPIGRPGPAG